MKRRAGMSNVNTDRRPYIVKYQKDGKEHIIKRVPPRKLHDMLPQDEVTITRKKNDYWDKGDKVKIRNISGRQPNTLQVENSDGVTTFLSYFDVFFKGRKTADIIAEDEAKQAKDPIGSKYLLWP